MKVEYCRTCGYDHNLSSNRRPLCFTVQDAAVPVLVPTTENYWTVSAPPTSFEPVLAVSEVGEFNWSKDAAAKLADLSQWNNNMGMHYILTRLYEIEKLVECKGAMSYTGTVYPNVEDMADPLTVKDMATFIRRLSRSLLAICPSHALPAKACEYLQREGFNANILREADE